MPSVGHRARPISRFSRAAPVTLLPFTLSLYRRPRGPPLAALSFAAEFPDFRPPPACLPCVVSLAVEVRCCARSPRLPSPAHATRSPTSLHGAPHVRSPAVVPPPVHTTPLLALLISRLNPTCPRLPLRLPAPLTPFPSLCPCCCVAAPANKISPK